MQEYSFYQLVDPRDNTIRYVGLSSAVLNRFAEHVLSGGRVNKVKAQWIEELKQAGLLPTLQVLETNIPSLDEARCKEARWISHIQASGAQLTNVAHTGQERLRRTKSLKPDTPLKEIRLSLGASQEGVARRTRSVSMGTVGNAESGKRVTYDTATQILEAINSMLEEAGRSRVTLDDLGLNLY